MSRSTLSFSLSVVLISLTLGGCRALNPHGGAPAPAHADSQVTVQNPQWGDLTIYVERDRGRMRLGVVPGNTSRTLVVPDAFVTPNCVLRLVALSTGREVQGSSSYFDLEPGSRAVWSVGITGLTTPVSLVPPAG